MNNTTKGKKRGIAAGLGLTAAGLLAAQSAEAATEVAQLADGDGRLGLLLTLFVPVVGWVAFNIAQVSEEARWWARQRSWVPIKELPLCFSQ